MNHCWTFSPYQEKERIVLKTLWPITNEAKIDNLVKSHQNDGFIVGARCFAPDIGHAQRAPTMQGAHNLRSRGDS